jgi:hypothetical protein
VIAAYYLEGPRQRLQFVAKTLYGAPTNWTTTITSVETDGLSQESKEASVSTTCTTEGRSVGSSSHLRIEPLCIEC